MGWGIRIPSLGVDTRKGEYFGGSGGPRINIGGDIGKFAEQVGEKTPIGWMASGGMPKVMGKTTGLASDLLFGKEQGYSPTDFSGLTSRWGAITNGFTGQGLVSSLGAQQQQAALGVNNSLANLQQFGGASVGAQDRLNRQSKWDTAMSQGQALQDAELSKNMSKQQGILGLELPIAIGKEQADAQARAARSRAGASKWGLVGGLLGAGVGSLAGPGGAAIGYNVGSGLGAQAGS